MQYARFPQKEISLFDGFLIHQNSGWQRCNRRNARFPQRKISLFDSFLKSHFTHMKLDILAALDMSRFLGISFPLPFCVLPLRGGGVITKSPDPGNKTCIFYHFGIF